VALAIESGVPPSVWLDDTRAMATAVELLDERAEEIERARRKRGA
jgi:hypothetical protein